MDKDALDFIKREGLVEQVEWPAFFLKITEAGYNFIAENSNAEGGL